MKVFKVQTGQIFALTALGMAMLSTAAIAQVPSDLSPLITTSSDRGIGAFYAGPQCGSDVNLVFKARSADEYDSSKDTAAQLMAVVVDGVRRTCSSVELVFVDGYANNELRYTGYSERSENWRVVEVGSNRAGLASGSAADEATQNEFAADGAFKSADAVSKAIGPDSILCESYEPQTNSCRAHVTLGPDSSGLIAMTMNTLDDEGGTVATIRSVVEISDGFACFATAGAEVSLSGGKSSERALAMGAERVHQRLMNQGKLACMGFQSKANGYDSETFDDLGRSVLTADYTLTSDKPRLRLDK